MTQPHLGCPCMPTPASHHASWLMGAAAGSLPPRDYTPAEALELFADAGLAQAQVLGPLLLGNSSANTTPPDTHFYGFIGTGGLGPGQAT